MLELAQSDKIWYSVADELQLDDVLAENSDDYDVDDYLSTSSSDSCHVATYFILADYQQWKLESQNIKHKIKGYFINITLGLRKRLLHFRTVYMFTSVRIYLLYCTYIIACM